MAIEIPDKMKEVVQQVNDGQERTETVRTLVSWFGYARRSYLNVREIRKALKKMKLKTEPDFEDAWIDGEVKFVLKVKEEAEAASNGVAPVQAVEVSEAAGEPASAPVPEKVAERPTNRIGRLAAANKTPLFIAPDTTITEAITLMLQHDYSQLPVMTSERNVKGMFSWKALGSRLALGRNFEKSRECMETAYEISSDASLFDAIQQIVEHECLLVRDGTHRITGIVTTTDLSMQFALLGEPFIQLGQIEHHIRSLIEGGKFTKADLSAGRDPADSGREIGDVDDLTLGEDVRLLENADRWVKLGVKVDRKTFIDELKRVVRIRNEVMHFNPDPFGEEDLTTLRKFARFLSELQKKLV